MNRFANHHIMGQPLADSPRQNLHHNFTAVVAAMADNELPVKVHSNLALTQMITIHESSL